VLNILINFDVFCVLKFLNFCTNCITTAAGVVTLEIGERSCINKANVFIAAFNKLTRIHFTNHSNFISLLFYLNIVLTVQQTSFY